MTTPDESIAAQAGLAREPQVDGAAERVHADAIDEPGSSDVETARDTTNGRVADLADEPSEAHVAAYAAAADELAERLDDSGAGHDDSSP